MLGDRQIQENKRLYVAFNFERKLISSQPGFTESSLISGHRHVIVRLSPGIQLTSLDLIETVSMQPCHLKYMHRDRGIAHVCYISSASWTSSVIVQWMQALLCEPLFVEKDVDVAVLQCRRTVQLLRCPGPVQLQLLVRLHGVGSQTWHTYHICCSVEQENNFVDCQTMNTCVGKIVPPQIGLKYYSAEPTWVRPGKGFNI